MELEIYRMIKERDNSASDLIMSFEQDAFSGGYLNVTTADNKSFNIDSLDIDKAFLINFIKINHGMLTKSALIKFIDDQVKKNNKIILLK